MTKIFYALLVAICFLSSSLCAKDKSVTNDYQVILAVNLQGKVDKVTTEPGMPKKLQEKTVKAFMGKQLGQKKVDGIAIPYQQKLLVSTKFLMGDSRISKRAPTVPNAH
ncbi:hypothetical protein [Kangiella sp. TOML190]|uniref:hypothetical protein n=1 Tax=Kangiella sp. TOML190 TaxID=2931351 RepID=UPI002041AE49|nr:hypothetical protein [Kangiella sp. TOML190]